MALLCISGYKQIVKLLILCPIPVEYNACRQVMGLRDIQPIAGCRSGRTNIGNNEILAVQSGPGKSRVTSATVAAIYEFEPDLILDSGACAGIEPGILIGEVILSGDCFEYDLWGRGIPRKRIPEMQLISGLGLLPPSLRESICREAVGQGRLVDTNIRVGSQACGEHLVNSFTMRERLHSLFYASGANWETAGVYIGSLRRMLPPLSFRIVTDLGDETALDDFRKQVKEKARTLYRYLQVLVETGWFVLFMGQWGQLSQETIRGLPAGVRP